MGAGVSDWRLARSVAVAGQLGVVSGTAIDNILARRLQRGDPGGHMRRALEHFPVPGATHRLLEKYFIPNGKSETAAFVPVPMFVVEPSRELLELTVAANFVEVFLAKEGHDGLVGINYLEKIQMPTLSSLYGALLAGVDYVFMGAGIPVEIPGVLDSLARHEPAFLKVYVDNADPQNPVRSHFDPREMVGELPPLKRPQFMAIISSTTLARSLIKRVTGRLDGFIIEASTAGGHNARPRGTMQLNDRGEPEYGPRDEVDLAEIAKHGLPFWLAGLWGDPHKLVEALDAGAAGIQVGTLFAFCRESGLAPQVRSALLEGIRTRDIGVFTDPKASPTGFPFKVAPLAGSLSEPDEYEARPRVCNLGYLRTPYWRDDGTLGYRCASEPVASYQKKGGDPAATAGRKCLCNGLLANIGLPQVRSRGYVEQPLITAGNDIARVRRFLQGSGSSYSAAEVIDYLLEAVDDRD